MDWLREQKLYPTKNVWFSEAEGTSRYQNYFTVKLFVKNATFNNDRLQWKTKETCNHLYQLIMKKVTDKESYWISKP